MLNKFLLILVGVGLTASAWGQAAAEYGMATSQSGVAAARVGSAFGKLGGKLSEQTGARTAKSLDQAMQENRRTLESKSQKGGATLHVQSTPDKARVVVDGMIVAQTPADLRLPVGAHTVEIRLPGFDVWRRQVTVVDGQTALLGAKLEQKYRSTVNLGSRE